MSEKFQLVLDVAQKAQVRPSGCGQSPGPGLSVVITPSSACPLVPRGHQDSVAGGGPPGLV